MSAVLPSQARAARPGAVVGIAGALGYVAVSLLKAVAPVGPAADGVLAVASLLLVGTVVAMARAGVAGASWWVRAGLAAAALSWLVIAAAYVVDLVLGADYPPPFVVATLLHLAGMATVGIGVLRARRWAGWQRFLPLVCGVFLALITPLLAGDGPVSSIAGAGWGLCWLALGAALLRLANAGVRS